MQFPIVIGLRRSRFLDGVLLIAALVGLTAVLLVPWHLVTCSLLGAAIVLVAFLVRQALTPRIRTLRIDHDGSLSCQASGESEFIPVRLLPGATAHPWLTVLRLAYEQGAYLLAIAPDAVAPDEFRRLRVWLRWRAEVNDGPGDS